MHIYILFINKFWPEKCWWRCELEKKLQVIQEAPEDLCILYVPSVLFLHDHPTLLYLLLVLEVPVVMKDQFNVMQSF